MDAFNGLNEQMGAENSKKKSVASKQPNGPDAGAPPQLPRREVLQRTCPRHGVRYQEVLLHAAPVMVLGRPLRIPPRRMGGCPLCAQEEQRLAQEIAQEQARLDAQRAVLQQFDRAGIPPRLQTKSFDNYDTPLKEQKAVLQKIREFADRFDEHLRAGSTLILSGPTGTGKGHLSAALGMTLLRQGRTVLMATATELTLRLRRSWRDPSVPDEIEQLRRLADLDLLIIDEAGVRTSSDLDRDLLFSIVDARYRAMRPMVLTTNLTPEELRDALGDRTYSRLREGGRWIVMNWEDWRGK